MLQLDNRYASEEPATQAHGNENPSMAIEHGKEISPVTGASTSVTIFAWGRSGKLRRVPQRARGGACTEQPSLTKLISANASLL